MFQVLESGIMLKSQDVVVAVVLATYPGREWGFAELGAATGLSQSAVFRAVQRLRQARLVVQDGLVVFRDRLLKFLEHGVPYAFAVAPGPVARGVVTAHSAPPLDGHIRAERAVVWPHPQGMVRGESLAPLCASVPEIAMGDARLHAALALVDALRIGRPREQKLAAKLLKGFFDDARIIPTAD